MRRLLGMGLILLAIALIFGGMTWSLGLVTTALIWLVAIALASLFILGSELLWG